MLELRSYRVEMNRLSKDAVTAILEAGKLYEVGGVVRDRFLGRADESKDRDYLVTGVGFDELVKLLRRHGKADLVGSSFGVIKFTQFTGGVPRTFDISLPRREHSIGVGHKDFVVDFDPDLSVEDDLARRDFTINAMALETVTDILIDPLGGMADLEKKCLRMVTTGSFEDDPLRMLRAVQFASRFDFRIEEKTYEAIKKHAALIKTVSAERIAEELNKLIGLSKNPSSGFRVMLDTGLLEEVLPELYLCAGVDQPGGYHKYDVFEHTMKIIDACRPDLRLRLAALFHDINKPQCKRIVEKGATFYGHDIVGSKTAQFVMKRLRYPNDLIKDVSILVERHMFTSDVTDKGLRRLIRRIGPELIFELLDLRRADVIAQGMGGTTEDVDVMEQRIRDELEKESPFSIADLKLSGRDLMKLLDINEGPMVGKVLEQLMEAVLDFPEQNQREVLESLAKDIYCTLDNRGSKV